MPLLSPASLQKVVPALSEERAQIIADLVNTICPTYGIDTENILHEFLATCAYESQGFSKKEENLNYSWQRLVDVFGKKYFRTSVEAQRYDHDPIKIANYVYGGRMGNIKPGDGWGFRGGAFIQATGRDIYTRYGKRNHQDPFVVADLVRKDDKAAMDMSCWIFAIEKRLVPLAQKDDFVTITKRINGGLNGLAEREAIYVRAKQYIIQS